MRFSFKHFAAALLLVTPLMASCGDNVNAPENVWDQVEGLVEGGAAANAAKASQGIGAQGGTLTAGPYTLTVPAGAVTDSLVFELVPTNNGMYALELFASKSGKNTHDEEVRFNKTLTFTVSYAGAEVVDPSKLVMVYVRSNGRTEPQITTIDTLNKTVTCQLQHFSRYALVQN